MDVLVTYEIATADVASERRLARVAAVCERYGIRAQYSVFECRVDEVLLQQLISELLDEMDPKQDSINIYRLGVSVGSARQSLGRPGLDWRRPWVI